MESTTQFTLCRCLAAALLLAAVTLTIPTSPVAASSHREAPAITLDPTADNTDVYAFVSYEEGRGEFVTLIANFIPLEDAAAGPNFHKFDPNVLYEIKIDNNGDALEDITYQFRFKTQVLESGTFLNATGPITDLEDANFNVRQSYSVTRIDTGGSSPSSREVLGEGLAVPPPNIGMTTVPDYESLADAAIHDLGDGSRVFAGPRDDGFYVDLGAVFDLLQLRSPGVDGTAGKNVHTIAIEVPISRLTEDGSTPTDPADDAAVVGVWSSASRPMFSFLPYRGGAPIGVPIFGFPLDRQVSRLGMPLVNEVVIPLSHKDRFNASHPLQDIQFLDFVLDPEVPRLLNLLYGLEVPPAPRTDLVEVFLTGIAGLNQPPNVRPAEMLRLNMAIPPTPADSINPMGVVGGDLAGFPNGRRVGDDVLDIVVQVAAGLLVDGTGEGLGDGVDGNDVPYLDRFPYLASPHAGVPALRSYEVTITNLTSGQPLTPPVVATHGQPLSVFQVGEPASFELKEIAENGNNVPLLDLLGADSKVSTVQQAGPPPLVPSADPGGTGFPDSVTFTITANQGAKYLSFASMLICTNDGFTGLDSQHLPKRVGESVTVFTNGYDAGTELNSEDFADIVPPCQGLIGVSSEDAGTGMSDPSLAEGGGIMAHPGILGGVDLIPGTHGWMGAVTQVEIERTN